jgi:hypothetical protein
MDALLRRLVRAGMRRGLGGEWAWLALAATAFVLRRALLDPGGKVSRIEVKPGEQLLISVHDGKDGISAVSVAPLPAESVGS